MKYIKYDKKEKFSYAIGQFATIELIKSKKSQITSFIFSDKIKIDDSVNFIIDFAKKNKIEINYNQKAIESISGKENCYCIGVFDKYTSKIDRNENHVVLVEPSDMGNMGTIIRTMLGFGLHNLAIINDKSCGVDVFNPKVIRASMGALFHLNIEYFNSFNDYNRICNNSKFAFCLNTDRYLQDFKINEIQLKFSLIFGNEASGLPNEIIEKCNKIKIRQSSEIDSFNLAISVALGLYHFTKQ